MKKSLKGAVALLIAIAMVFSSVAIADTQTKKVTLELSAAYSGSATGARGDVVWDNGMEFDGLGVAQQDDPHQFWAYIADDFHFDVDTEVLDVHWIGGYWAGDPQQWDWCISFMLDDGSGERPADDFPQNPSYAGPFCFTWAEIAKEDLGSGYFSMSVELPEIITFPGCEKFWISIWGVGVYLPFSGWGLRQENLILHEAIFKSEFHGFPDWTDSFDVFGYAADMCFQLTGPYQCEPSIDIEKLVWDEKNQDWVDADTETEALDVPICNDVTFRIVITNTGECPLVNVIVKDIMHNSLKYIIADPEPDEFSYFPPYYYTNWYIPSPLLSGETIEIHITAHVEGPKCSYDFNHVKVDALCGCGELGCTCPPQFDEDYAYVHATGDSRTLNRPFLQFLDSHPNLFPLLQKLLFSL